MIARKLRYRLVVAVIVVVGGYVAMASPERTAAEPRESHSSSADSMSAMAAWPGPDGFGYSGSSCVYQWIDIAGTGTPVWLADDAYRGSIAIGFPFPFYGTSYTGLYVSSNGFISLGTAPTYNAWEKCPLPNASEPNNLIALMWDALDPDYTDPIYYQSFASCPVGSGACFVVTYHNFHHYQFPWRPIAGTFQAILYESGVVRLQYQDAGERQGATSTTGMEAADAAAGWGLTYACDTADSLSDQLCLEMEPGGLSLAPAALEGPFHADRPTTFAMSLSNNTGVSATFNMSYPITSGNAVVLGPSALMLDDGALETFEIDVVPNPGLPNGTQITGTVGASGASHFASSTISFTMVPPLEILHQWSFTSDATDSVGGADAVLYNGAAVAQGALQLDGVDDYAELPIATTLSSLTYVSMEMWVTWTGSRAWERFFDIGTGTEVYWFMTPRVLQTGMPRVAITTAGQAGEQLIDSPWPIFPIRTHVVFTLDGAGASEQMKLYINGARVATHSETSALDPVELGPLTNIWLGRSQYAVDPYFSGAIHELVIYGTVLSDLEVNRRYTEIFADGFEGGDTESWSSARP